MPYCGQCYHQLHYAADGTLLYSDFRVFDYHHDV
jgi:snRNA-activating protein complex subunit 3